MSLRGNQLVNNFSTMAQQYQRDLDFLLSAYRTANRSTRTDPAPAHFSKPKHIDPEITVPPAFDPPDATSLSGVAGEVDKAIRQLQDVYQRSMRQYRTLEDVLTEASGKTSSCMNWSKSAHHNDNTVARNHTKCFAITLHWPFFENFPCVSSRRSIGRM